MNATEIWLCLAIATTTLQVGRLLDALKKLGLANNTVVAVAGDHARDQRTLESLGYVAGGLGGGPKRNGSQLLPDIKDMIGFLNRLHGVTELMDDEKFEDAAAILEPWPLRFRISSAPD